MPRVNNAFAEKQKSDRIRVAKIQYYRTVANITDKQLASAAGITDRTLRNRWKNPDDFTLGEIRRMNKLLKIPSTEMAEII